MHWQEVVGGTTVGSTTQGCEVTGGMTVGGTTEGCEVTGGTTVGGTTEGCELIGGTTVGSTTEGCEDALLPGLNSQPHPSACYSVTSLCSIQNCCPMKCTMFSFMQFEFYFLCNATRVGQYNICMGYKYSGL